MAESNLLILENIMTDKTDDFKPVEAVLGRLNGIQYVMYPVYDKNDVLIGYDYGVDSDSLWGMFPMALTTDVFGRRMLSVETMIHIMGASIKELNSDLDVLYQRVANLEKLLKDKEEK